MKINYRITSGSQPSTARLLLVMGLLVGTIAGVILALNLLDVALAAPPIEGNPISVQGPTAIPGTSHGVIRAVVAADLDTDGYPDLAFGQADLLRIKLNVGVTTTQWAQTVTVGSATYDIRAVAAIDLDRDGAIDLVSASADDTGNSQLRLWRNPTSPFTNSWTVSNTLATSAISLTTVAAADLDRNGTPDLVSGGLDGILRLWSNPLTGTQAFTTSWSSPVTITMSGNQIRQVLIADADRDGLLDIVVAAGDGNSGALYMWQNPTTTFTSSWTVSHTLAIFTSTVLSLGMGDLDNDGAPDLLAGLDSGAVIAWRNPITGAQPFTTGWSISSTVGDAALPIKGLSLTDADHDGLLDVVAAGSGVSSTLTAWRNTGQPFSGGWSSVSIGATSDAVFALAASDFNRDGDTDFVTARGNTGNSTGGLQFWPNELIRSAPRFETPSVSNSTANPLFDVGLHAMDMHDMDRDGLPDIVVATLGGSLLLARNDGTPFSSSDWPTVTIGSAPSFFSVIVGDLDGDGWPDIATSTALTATGNHVHIWHNDGTPFSGTWISQTAGTFPRQVMDLALGDVGREGGLQIVAATGITTTFENHGERNVITSTNNRIWLMRPPAGNLFASAWISSTACTTTYSANDVALGDLDNDGWMDVVFATDHAPSAGSNPDDWPDAYQVRACRSLGNPYSPSGWQDYDIGRDDSPVSIVAGNHQFWGAHAWGVAVGDLDNDGYPDVVSGGGAEGDYQVLVYKNDGTPFNSGHWEPTAVGYGTRFESGASCTTVSGYYPEDCPWLETSVPAVSLGDLNSDGLLDIVSGFGHAYTYMPLWLNTGVPFGETVTDTHWVRYNIGGVASRPVYGVEAADLDQDGRLDVAAVTSWFPPSHLPSSGPLRVWRNLGGILRHTFAVDYGNLTIQDGAKEGRITFTIKNNGRAYDHNLELDYLKVRMARNGSNSNYLSSTEADALFQSVQIYRDANGDDAWQPTDTPVVTVTNFSLSSGWQTFDFSTGDPPSAVSPTQTATYFVVFNMEPTASQNGTVSRFRLHYTVHQSLLARDSGTQAPVSIAEDSWRMTPWIYPVSAPAATITMDALPTAISADGFSTSTITATVTTAYGYPVLDGTVVTFTTSAGNLPSSPYATMTNDGVATAVLTSGITPGTAIITGTVSASVVDTVTVGFLNIRASLRINDAPGAAGSAVTTHTMSADGALQVYVAAYDASSQFINNPTDVTWGGTGIVDGNLSQTAGVSSTTFAPVLVGTGAITVADGSGNADATDTITVTLGALAAFTVTSPSPQTAGQPFSVTVTAYDADGNLKTDYTGLISFTSSDGQAVLPVDDGSGWSDGASDFTLELRTTGVQTYSVADGTAAQASNGITVNPAELGYITVSPSEATITAGDVQTYTAEAFDIYDNSLGDVTTSTVFSIVGGGHGGSWSDNAYTSHTVGDWAVRGLHSGHSDDAALSVEEAGLSYILISPDSAAITAGDVQTYTAEAFDVYDNSLGDVTTSTVFSIVGGGHGGSWSDNAYTSHTAGDWTVRGVYSGRSDDAALSVEEAGLSYIVISPDSAAITAGDVQTYTAEAFDIYDNSLGDVTTSTVFSIVGGGHGGSWSDNAYTSHTVGDWAVRGLHSGHSDDAALSVEEAGLSYILISPDSAAITAGDVQTYTAEAFDVYDNSLGDVTTSTVFSIVGGGHGGSWSDNAYTSHTAGDWTVRGVYSGRSDDAALSVEEAGLSYILISPDSVTITAGDVQTYTAEAFDIYDNSLGGVTTGTVFSIVGGGHGGSWSDNAYTSHTAGDWTVRGVYSGRSDDAALSVEEAGLSYILISPDSVTITAGDVQTYTAEAFDIYDNSLGGVTTGTVFSIVESGHGGSWTDNVYTSHAAGDWIVRGVYSGHSDDAALSVEEAGLSYILISPDSVTITAGDVQTYTAEAFDIYDNSLGGVTTGTVFSIVESGHGGSWSDNVYTSNVSGNWTVSGTHSGEVDTAALAVSTGVVHHFVFETISDQIVNRAFTVRITAQDEHNNTVIAYNGVAILTDTTGTITPTVTGSFSAGVWTGDVTIMQAQDGATITAQYGNALGVSGSFNVNSYTVFLPLVIRGD